MIADEISGVSLPLMHMNFTHLGCTSVDFDVMSVNQEFISPTNYEESEMFHHGLQ